MHELTDEQTAAVQSEAEVTYVTAGPGTGKTSVLAERVRYLIEHEHVDPARILVLTFTRRAAKEVEERINADSLTAPGEKPTRWPIVCGTFHAVCLSLLQEKGRALGYTPGLQVLDAVDANEVFDEIATELGHRDANSGRWKGSFTLGTLVAVRDVYYQTGKWMAAAGSDAIRLVKAYHERLFSLNSLDFGLILSQTSALLAKPEIGALYRNAYDHVLVDEAQDCDEIQYTLHTQFCPPAKLFMVGDPRQCIYGWRGATPDLVGKLHPEAEVLPLTGSFRCTPEILIPANALMDKAPAIESLRWENIRPGPAVVLATGRSVDICGIAARLHHCDDFAWNEIAVLCRTHSECKRLASVFGEAGLPYNRVGSSFDLCSTKPFRDIYAAMRLAANMRDEHAFSRVAPYLGIGPQEAATLRVKAVDGRCTRFEAAGRGRKNNAVLTAIARTEPGDDLTLFLERLVPAMAEEWSGGFGSEVAVGLQRVWNWWSAWQPHRKLSSALSWIPLRDPTEGQMAADRELITISTIHAAKGLEWPAVIVPNLGEGSLPTSRSIKAGDERIDEERRVLYVAMTRAKDRLVLHYRAPCDQSEKGTKRLPSRFLIESGLLQASEIQI